MDDKDGGRGSAIHGEDRHSAVVLFSMDRPTLAEQLLKLADNLEYGYVPAAASRELRKLAQEVQPGAGVPPSDRNEVARWNLFHERMDALEKEMKDVQERLRRTVAAGVSLGNALSAVAPRTAAGIELPGK